MNTETPELAIYLDFSEPVLRSTEMTGYVADAVKYVPAYTLPDEEANVFEDILNNRKFVLSGQNSSSHRLMAIFSFRKEKSKKTGFYALTRNGDRLLLGKIGESGVRKIASPEEGSRILDILSRYHPLHKIYGIHSDEADHIASIPAWRRIAIFASVIAVIIIADLILKTVSGPDWMFRVFSILYIIGICAALVNLFYSPAHLLSEKFSSIMREMTRSSVSSYGHNAEVWYKGVRFHARLKSRDGRPMDLSNTDFRLSVWLPFPTIGIDQKSAFLEKYLTDVKDALCPYPEARMEYRLFSDGPYATVDFIFPLRKTTKKQIRTIANVIGYAAEKFALSGSKCHAVLTNGEYTYYVSYFGMKVFWQYGIRNSDGSKCGRLFNTFGENPGFGRRFCTEDEFLEMIDRLQ